MSNDPIIIRDEDIVLLPVEAMERHPENRLLGLNTEVIEGLKASISANGFLRSHPLTVRQANGDSTFQILKGEHRWTAAKELGMQELPCCVVEVDDTEARLMLLDGNIQSGNAALEYGLCALEVVVSNDKQGLSLVAFAKRYGLGKRIAQVYLDAAEVYRYVSVRGEEFATGCKLLTETVKLAEIASCPQTDWLWLHNLVVERELSNITLDAVRDLLDLDAIKQKIVHDVLDTAKPERNLAAIITVITAIQQGYESLDSCVVVFYTYDVTDDIIRENAVDLRQRFLDELRGAKLTEDRAADAINKTRPGSLAREANVQQGGGSANTNVLSGRAKQCGACATA